MIDFHNHVLPDVDDGSKTLEESISMLRCAHDQGVTDVVQTVHFQHPKMDGKNIEYNYLLDKVKELQSKINSEKLNITIHLSAEVFYLPNLIEISKNPLVTLGNKKYMLIEFLPNIRPIDYESQFYELQQSGITPIVAHPERYSFVQKDINVLSLWIDRGYVIQIDAGSIIGHFGKLTRKICLDMIGCRYVNLIGSDSHNNRKRNFCIKEAYDIIENKFGINYVNMLKKNSQHILKGKDVLEINYDKNNIFDKIVSFMNKKINKFKD
mgnify:CR=1 FL=1